MINGRIGHEAAADPRAGMSLRAVMRRAPSYSFPSIHGAVRLALPGSERKTLDCRNCRGPEQRL